MIENEIKLFINENVKPYTRWKGTCMEGYHNLSNKKKGDLGEKIVSDLINFPDFVFLSTFLTFIFFLLFNPFFLPVAVRVFLG